MDEMIYMKCTLCTKEVKVPAEFESATFVFCKDCTKEWGGPSGAAEEAKNRNKK